MRRGSPLQALAVVTIAAGICALLVSTAVVWLRPIQADTLMVRQARVVLGLLGTREAAAAIDDTAVLRRFRSLDHRVVDLVSGRFEPARDPLALELADAQESPDPATAIPPEQDWVRLGHRPRFLVVHLEWDQGRLKHLVLPIVGSGMWSTIRGYVMLEGDLNTVAGATFYNQAETPGLGDRITGEQWLKSWRGRKIYDEAGVVQFAVASGRIAPGSASALYKVDALTGATVTADAVTDIMRFWFGPWGFQGLLRGLHETPPAPPGNRNGDNP